jgi:hypothetical protein
VENEYLWIRWKSSDLSEAMFTEAELKHVHRSFGHPSVVALWNVLRNARPEEVSPATRAALESISRDCWVCAGRARKPRYFKLTVGADDFRFTHIVAVDVMYLSGRPVLHFVDEATHFAAAKFLKNTTATETWKALCSSWTRIYLGPPAYLRIDQGVNFAADEFRAAASAFDIGFL